MEETPAVETVDLTKQYRRVRALDGLTMTVARGEVFGFLGPNGAGKTTVVKLLLGLARASGGSGRVLGAPLGDRATRRRVGYLPELFRYQPWMRAREVLAFHCELARLARGEWRAAIDSSLALVGLADRADDVVGTFSKGMQQRLGIGVAMLGTQGRPETRRSAGIAPIRERTGRGARPPAGWALGRIAIASIRGPCRADLVTKRATIAYLFSASVGHEWTRFHDAQGGPNGRSAGPLRPRHE